MLGCYPEGLDDSRLGKMSIHGDEDQPIHGDEDQPIHGDEDQPIHGDEGEDVMAQEYQDGAFLPWHR
jgi:hypothetical protein